MATRRISKALIVRLSFGDLKARLPALYECCDFVVLIDRWLGRKTKKHKSGWLHFFLSHQSYHLSLRHHWDNGLWGGRQRRQCWVCFFLERRSFFCDETPRNQRNRQEKRTTY